jgi:hypothetical protein
MENKGKFVGGREVISFTDTERSVFSQKQWFGGEGAQSLYLKCYCQKLLNGTM